MNPGEESVHSKRPAVTSQSHQFSIISSHLIPFPLAVCSRAFCADSVPHSVSAAFARSTTKSAIFLATPFFKSSSVTSVAHLVNNFLRGAPITHPEIVSRRAIGTEYRAAFVDDTP